MLEAGRYGVRQLIDGDSPIIALWAAMPMAGELAAWRLGYVTVELSRRGIAPDDAVTLAPDLFPSAAAQDESGN